MRQILKFEKFEDHHLCNFSLKMTENEAPSHNSANSTLRFASEESKPTIKMINNTNLWSKPFRNQVNIKSISLPIRLVRPVQSQGSLKVGDVSVCSTWTQHRSNVPFLRFPAREIDRKIGRWTEAFWICHYIYSFAICTVCSFMNCAELCFCLFGKSSLAQSKRLSSTVSPTASTENQWINQILHYSWLLNHLPSWKLTLPRKIGHPKRKPVFSHIPTIHFQVLC